MPAAEVLVTINGPTAITFNDYSSGTPAYVLRGTPEMLSPPEPDMVKVHLQGEHGVSDSLSWYPERILTFEGEIVGSSQADRKTKEEALKRCLSLHALQAYGGTDGYVLVEITDEDGVGKQCYAKIVSKVNLHVLDNTDPSRRSFDFVMIAKDPFLYEQDVESATGGETFVGTNFTVVEGTSPTVPFQLYDTTPPSITCSVGGTVDTPPVITIPGPTTSPKVTNVTTGKFFELTALTLVAGESVTVDVSKRTILKNNGTDLSAYWGTGSSWWYLEPGTNVLTLLDATPTVILATATVAWRNAYL